MRRKAILAALASALCVTMISTASGCSGQEEPFADLDSVHETYKETTVKVSGLTGFFDALEEFDLENGMFLEDARAAVERSRSEADEVDDALHELRDYDYDGEMKELGEDIKAYCEQVETALAELEEMYRPLLDLLQAMEPALREEAVITQLDVPESDEEFIRRLLVLERALASTTGALPQVQVPESLEKYKVLMVQVFDSLKAMVGDLLDLAGGQAVDFDLNDNEPIRDLQTILQLNDPLLEFIRDGLKVNHLDVVTQEVEDAFYELFLERGSQDEEKR